MIGFNGESRIVYYPKVGAELLLLKESELNQFHSVQVEHIRPGKVRQRDDNGAFDSDDDDIMCPICFEVFASDPSDRMSGRLPIQARHCGHVICMDCFQKRRIELSAGGGATFRASIECPICRRSESFVAETVVTCLTMCQLVERSKKIQAKIIPKPAPNLALTNHRTKRSLPGADKQSNSQQKATRHSKQSVSAASNYVRYQCTLCQKSKPEEKFSKKQAGRARCKKNNILCRRCEEKGILKKELGSGCEGISFQLHQRVEKSNESAEKFLATVVPWPLTERKSCETPSQFPRSLILDGYTRERWSLLDDGENDSPWRIKTLYSSTGSRMGAFLNYLKEHKKSAFGTYGLQCGTDGFFVVPHDQSSQNPCPNMFACKYILGLGLVEPNAARIGGQATFTSGDDSTKSGILGKILNASNANCESLSAVAKGSVHAVKPDSSVPRSGLAGSSGKGCDWYRPRTTVEEEETKNEGH